MSKQLIYSEEARKKLKAGVDKMARAVTTTLGPKGRNVGLEKSWGAPTVTHDGVTVAKEIDLKNPFENMGAQIVKEAAQTTNDVAGDGTTTATLLVKSIVDDGMRNIAAGSNPMLLRNGISMAAEKVSEELEKLAHAVSSKEEKAQIATISAADPEIGQTIADALEKVGDNGVVTVEEGRGLKIEVDYKEGMQLERGFVSPYFVTDSERMESVIEDAYILLTDKKISSMQELLPMLENFVQVSKNLVIIAEDIDGEALATLVVNKLKGTFNCLAIKAPGFGDRSKEMLSDIAVLTGANVISEDMGRTLESAVVDDLGRAERVIATEEESVVVGGQGDEAEIKKRVEQLKKQISETDSDFEQEKLQERLAKLAGGVAVINVGAATELELKEKKARVEDAVNATRAAIEAGVVPGGGVSLLRAREVLKDLRADNEDKLETDVLIGIDILYSALERPLRKLVENAGVDSGWVLREVLEKEATVGFDVLSLEFVDMVESGIIDPAKVTISALQNAASAAEMLLTTECLIADLPQDNDDSSEPSAGGGMPRGMGGMAGMGGMGGL